METETNYIEAISAKYAGDHGSLGIKILIDIDRELTQEDNHNLRVAVENIHESLVQETIKLDPASAIESANERKGIINLFEGRAIYVEEIPNGYCSRYCCKHLPWFIVTTKFGRIKIGWRKRVIEIDWSDSAIPSKAQTLFPDEDVTKQDKLIHAWGLDKAREYIQILLS